MECRTGAANVALPGVDDIMAMLLALSASPEELEVAMISVTYGNVPLQRYIHSTVPILCVCGDHS